LLWLFWRSGLTFFPTQAWTTILLFWASPPLGWQAHTTTPSICSIFTLLLPFPTSFSPTGSNPQTVPVLPSCSLIL
jgi:hypothetical protein